MRLYEVIIETTILIILLALSAFFSASETALFSIGEIRIRRMIKEGRRGARTLQKIKSEPGMLLTTILIGNNIVNISATAIATVLAIRIFGDVGTGIAVGVLTVLILVFGEIFPKSIAYNHATRISLLVSKPLRILMIVLWPISKMFSKANEKLTKPTDKGVTEEDVKIALTMGEEAGEIEKDEKIMIHNVFDFTDTNVSQIMTPRDEIIDIKAASTIKDAIDMMVREGASRLPVYEKERDNIIGLVYIKDMMKHIENSTLNKNLKEDIKPVLFVPETQKLDDLLFNLRRKKIYMAIVVDESGNVQGLVTIEDLVEEIVGEIYDESDNSEGTEIKKVKRNTFIAEGKAKIIDIRKRYGIKLTDTDVNTVAGFITEQLERLPKENEVIEAKNGWLITVLEVTDKEILKVRIEKK